MTDDVTTGGASLSFFERRRRLRRLRMIVELTANVLRHDTSLTYRQARSLVDCARRSILDHFPQYLDRFEKTVQPSLEGIIVERWPTEELLDHCPDKIVN